MSDLVTLGDYIYYHIELLRPYKVYKNNLFSLNHILFLELMHL